MSVTPLVLHLYNYRTRCLVNIACIMDSVDPSELELSPQAADSGPSCHSLGSAKCLSPAPKQYLSGTKHMSHIGTEGA